MVSFGCLATGLVEPTYQRSSSSSGFATASDCAEDFGEISRVASSDMSSDRPIAK